MVRQPGRAPGTGLARDRSAVRARPTRRVRSLTGSPGLRVCRQGKLRLIWHTSGRNGLGLLGRRWARESGPSCFQGSGKDFEAIALRAPVWAASQLGSQRIPHSIRLFGPKDLQADGPRDQVRQLQSFRVRLLADDLDVKRQVAFPHIGAVAHPPKFKFQITVLLPPRASQITCVVLSAWPLSRMKEWSRSSPNMTPRSYGWVGNLYFFASLSLLIAAAMIVSLRRR